MEAYVNVRVLNPEVRNVVCRRGFNLHRPKRPKITKKKTVR